MITTRDALQALDRLYKHSCNDGFCDRCDESSDTIRAFIEQSNMAAEHWELAYRRVMTFKEAEHVAEELRQKQKEKTC